MIHKSILSLCVYIYIYTHICTCIYTYVCCLFCFGPSDVVRNFSLLCAEGFLLLVLWVFYWVLGIRSKLVMCKASAYPTLLYYFSSHSLFGGESPPVVLSDHVMVAIKTCPKYKAYVPTIELFLKFSISFLCDMEKMFQFLGPKFLIPLNITTVLLKLKLTGICK